MVTITCLEDALFILGNIYGYCLLSQNSKLLEELDSVLNELSKYPVAKVILGGDFNMVMDNQLDRCPPKLTPNKKKTNWLYEKAGSNWYMEKKKNTSLKTYTWSNRSHTLQSWIDFWLISADLEPSIESCTVSPAVLTDHKAISLASQVSKE